METSINMEKVNDALQLGCHDSFYPEKEMTQGKP